MRFEDMLPVLVAAAVLGVGWPTWGLLRWSRKRAMARALRSPLRGWGETQAAWRESGALTGGWGLPRELSALDLLHAWAWCDPDSVSRLANPGAGALTAEAIWTTLPTAHRDAAEARLRDAVARAGTWWGGAEQGWNGRPLLLPKGSIGRQALSAVIAVEDLTGAPKPAGLNLDRCAELAPAELPVILAALRNAVPDLLHPLQPAKATGPTGGMHVELGSSLGRRVGGGLGAVLGPIGSMVGQYLGELVGRKGAESIARPELPPALAGALTEAEEALEGLGALAEAGAFSEAVREPEELILAHGRELERLREARAGRIRERIWSTGGMLVLGELVRATADELQDYRDAAALLRKVAAAGPATVRGGLLLQNPWLVRRLQNGPSSLSATRAALNRAARALRG